MKTAAPKLETPPRRAELGAGLALSWLLLGSALVAAVAAIGGWHRVLAIWLASALTLAALLLWDSIADVS